MNFTRENHPQLGCSADVKADFDRLAQQAASVPSQILVLALSGDSLTVLSATRTPSEDVFDIASTGTIEIRQLRRKFDFMERDD